MQDVVIVSGARTPIGSFNGALAGVHAAKLGATAIKAAVERAGIDAEIIDQVFMGCVLPAGMGQAPARQAMRYAGLPDSIAATTINKVCGSGLRTVMLGAYEIMTGNAAVVVAGGLENMSQAPYSLPKARTGYRMGPGKVEDLMVKDGLWDPYGDKHMGMYADLCAETEGISRQRQDDFAAESYKRALKATADGVFADEIAPVEVPQRRGDPKLVEIDEEPQRFNEEKMRKLRAAFNKDGSVTAGNASSINDGAAAVVLMSAAKAAELGITPMARLGAMASHAEPPEWFTKAPAYCCDKVLAKAGLTAADIDLWEVNEAFSVVALFTQDHVGYSADQCNVNGGAVAIGHPIGASGTRIFVTLLYEMAKRDAKRGLATLCIGGGEAVALIVERD